MPKLNTERSIMPLLIAFLVAVCLPILLLLIGVFAVSRGLIVFSMVMMGILGIAYYVYMIIYFWSICEDLNTLCLPYEPDAKEMSPNWVAVIFLGILLPFYMPYWWVRQGNRLWFRAKKNYNVSLKENGSTYLCWNLLGIVTLSIGYWIGLHKFFNNLNMVCSAFNNGYGKKNPCPYDCRPIAIEKPDAKREPVQPLRPKKKGCIVCVGGTLQGAVVDIPDGQEIYIGRDSKSSNVVISDTHVSKRHCGVRYNATEDRYYVTDYSMNGVFYKNGQPFIKNIATSCPKQTVFVLGKTNNEFLVK